LTRQFRSLQLINQHGLPLVIDSEAEVRLLERLIQQFPALFACPRVNCLDLQLAKVINTSSLSNILVDIIRIPQPLYGPQQEILRKICLEFYDTVTYPELPCARFWAGLKVKTIRVSPCLRGVDVLSRIDPVATGLETIQATFLRGHEVASPEVSEFMTFLASFIQGSGKGVNTVIFETQDQYQLQLTEFPDTELIPFLFEMSSCFSDYNDDREVSWECETDNPAARLNRYTITRIYEGNASSTEPWFDWEVTQLGITDCPLAEDFLESLAGEVPCVKKIDIFSQNEVSPAYVYAVSLSSTLYRGIFI
jgi:hypothetical protein